MAYVNRPDNLRSTDTFEILVGVAGTRAVLAPGGLKNMFINGVPVEDGQGNASFKDIYVDLFDGNPTILNTVNLKLGQSGTQVGLNLAVTNTYTNDAPGEWVNGSITALGCDYVDLRFVVQQLYLQTKDGIGDETATIEIQMRPSGTSTWINPLLGTTTPTYSENGTLDGITEGNLYYQLANPVGGTVNGYLSINGKTTSPYVKELRIAVPNKGGYANKSWEVRVRLREIDYKVYGEDGENEVRRTILWESIAGVNSQPLGGTEAWRGLSYFSIYGKASDQINGIPEVTSIFDLGTFTTPPSTVWNPLTRVYSGATWDGTTTVTTWTQCPAWQIKGLIEDSLSGVSALAPGSTLNKWDALEASKWFAQLVPDGRGGTHPRYSANWYLDQPMSVHDMVNYLAGAVGAFCWDEGNGQWRMKVERPENPAMTFTKENILGEFTYSHTDFDTRYNDIIGTFRNEELQFKEDRVRVFDQVNIDETGRRPTTIALVGCTNRQEALRRLQIRLLTSIKETKMVTFVTNRQGLLLEPFSVISVADADLNSDTTVRSTGRIVSMNAARTEITVRDSLRLELGVDYQVQLTVPNPDYNPNSTTQPGSQYWRSPTITITRTLINSAAQRGDVYTLYLDAALPANTPANANLSLSAPGLPSLPKQYRVINVNPQSDGETVSITAMEVYTAKWVESDSVTEEQLAAQTSYLGVVPPAIAPTSGVFSIRTYPGQTAVRTILTASWIRPNSLFQDGFGVRTRFNQGPWSSELRTSDTSYEFVDPAPGVYEISIVAYDKRGRQSAPLVATYSHQVDVTIPPSAFLTNEAILLPSDSAGTVLSYSGANGYMTLTSAVGAITNGVVYSVVAGSATGGLNVTIDATGLYVVSALVSDTGQATLRATWNGLSFDKVLSVAKVRAGSNGSPGSSASVLTLSTTAQTFNYDGTGAPSPSSQTITLIANLQNLTGTPSFTATGYNSSGASLGALTLGGTGATRTITNTAFGSAAYAVITASLGGFSDTVTIVRLTAGLVGSSPIVGFLTNEATTLAADSAGNVASFTPAAGSFKVFEGVVDRTSSATFSVVTTTGCSVTINATGDYSVTAMSADTASASLQAVYAGVTIQKILSLAKSKAGTNGSPGTPGLDGTPALYGTLTSEVASVFAYAGGEVVSYSPATTQFKVFSGLSDVSANFSITVPNNPQALSVAIAGTTVSVTAGFDANEDTASITLRATGSGPYEGKIIDKVFSLAKMKGGYEIVSALPTTNLFQGRIVFLTSDNKLYRYNGTAWVASVPANDITGQITTTQISDDAITTAKIFAGAVTADEIAAGAVTAAKMSVTQLSAITATIGVLRTATTGARTEIRDNVIKVYDASNVLRVKLGDLSL